MARPKKSEAPNLAEAHDLTAGVIERLQCPPGKPQAFLRDSKSPSLRVRVTPPSTKNPEGVKAFVFEAKLNRATLRMTIGDVRAWSIDSARIEANRLRVLVDQGIDPRELEREKEAAAAVKQAQEEAKAVTFGDAWAVYIEARKNQWAESGYTSHLGAVEPGGQPRKRWKGKLTIAGPLAPLVPMRLADINSDVLIELVTVEKAKLKEPAKEGETIPDGQKQRMGSVRSAMNLLSVFFNWCMAQKRYKDFVKENPVENKELRELLPAKGTRSDVLEREQLAAWFEQVRQISNPIIAACLQCILLTGVRRDELLTLRWDNVDMRWNKMTVKDKVHPTRTLPLTPYVKYLLQGLPRVNEWVFPSIRAVSLDDKHVRRRERWAQVHGKPALPGGVVMRSASGHIEEPAAAHKGACEAAGIVLTIHGLRRSFATLSEWVDMPAGMAAQIQGHAPSGIREKHYIRRPLDIVREHHTRFEAWVLQNAGIDFKPEPDAQQPRLVVVKGAAA